MGTDMKTYLKVPNHIAQSKELSLGAKLCYGRLVQYIGNNQYCYPSYATLGQELGISERQAKRYVKELIEHGLINKKRRGKEQTNLYYLSDGTNMSFHDGTDMTCKEISNIINKNNVNGLSSEEKRQHPISFEEYKRLYPIQEEVIPIISMYMQIYRHTLDRPHPPLRPPVWHDLSDMFLEYDYDFDDHKQMMLKHFATKYTQHIDYNICHYATDGIMTNRFYEAAY